MEGWAYGPVPALFMWQPGWGTGASVLGDSSSPLPSSPALAPSLSVSLSSSQLPSASLQPLLLCDPASRLGDGSASDSDDSKESIFSGLEDSGSDSSEDTDQDVDEDEDEDGAGTDRTAAAVAQVSEWVRSPGEVLVFLHVLSEPQGCVLASPLHQGVLPDVSHVTLPTWLWSLLIGPLASLTPTPLALPWKSQ